MRFEELANRAGRAASAIGRASERPPLPRLVERYRRRQLIMTWSTAVAAITLVVMGTVSLWPGSDSDLTPLATLTPLPGSTAAAGRESCPVTTPGEDSFQPVSQTPQMTPPGPLARWYGTPQLWTSIHPEGEIWEGLPAAADGTLTQKTFWWSEDIVSITDPVPDMEFYAERLDGTGQPVPARQVTSGGNAEQGVFVIAGFQIPEEGCWRITAEYLGSSVSYVAWLSGVEQIKTIALLDGSHLMVTGASGLEMAGYQFTVEVPGVGPSAVDLAPGLDPADPSIVDETALLEAKLGDSVRIFRADRDGQPLFMTVDLGKWVATLNVGYETVPASQDLLSIADRVKGTVGADGVVLSNYTPEVFTTYLREPGTENRIHLMANQCAGERVPGSDVAEHPRLGQVTRGPGYASWCDSASDIEVVVHGDESFIERMLDDVRISRS